MERRRLQIGARTGAIRLREGAACHARSVRAERGRAGARSRARATRCGLSKVALTAVAGVAIAIAPTRPASTDRTRAVGSAGRRGVRERAVVPRRRVLLGRFLAHAGLRTSEERIVRRQAYVVGAEFLARRTHTADAPEGPPAICRETVSRGTVATRFTINGGRIAFRTFGARVRRSYGAILMLIRGVRRSGIMTSAAVASSEAVARRVADLKAVAALRSRTCDGRSGHAGAAALRGGGVDGATVLPGSTRRRTATTCHRQHDADGAERERPRCCTHTYTASSCDHASKVLRRRFGFNNARTVASTWSRGSLRRRACGDRVADPERDSEAVQRS